MSPPAAPDAVHVRLLDGAAAHAHVDALADVLVDCVDGGASVSFMAPLAPEVARAFWRDVARGVAAGDRLLLVAEDGPGGLEPGLVLGTVQLVFARPENQPHRADVAKMLVRRSARRCGVGEQLLRAAELAALAAGRSLLVLDTVTGSDAERLYARLGWTRVGVVPEFALWPDGRPCDTTFFYKRVSAPA